MGVMWRSRARFSFARLYIVSGGIFGVVAAPTCSLEQQRADVWVEQHKVGYAYVHCSADCHEPGRTRVRFTRQFLGELEIRGPVRKGFGVDRK